MPRFRNFEEDDLYEVVNLANTALDEDYDGGLFLQLGDLYPEGFIVAEDETTGDVVGFILGVVQRAYEARILILAVDRAYRKQGIGTRLVRMFVDRFRRNGIHRLNLEVRASNTPAIRFYERMGFQRKSVIDGYYRDGEDAYLMTRSI